MTVVIIRMKVHLFVHNEHVHRIVFVVRKIIAAYLLLGIVMAMMIVAINLMNQKIIVKVKSVLVLVICSPVIMVIAYQEFISAMETTIVWTIQTKMNDINATLANVIPNVNLLVLPIKIGAEANVYLKDGFVMVILIVWMVPMRIVLCILVLHLKLVTLINLNAIIIDVSVKNGFAVCCIGF